MALKIKEVLKEKNVSVIQLAGMLGVSRSACYQFINGNPSAYRLETIAKALHVNVGDLFEPIIDE